jgi:ectoine hydroxylase-related dioxygenase (phytanoyl-CoA dioxygenase family)
MAISADRKTARVDARTQAARLHDHGFVVFGRLVSNADLRLMTNEINRIHQEIDEDTCTKRDCAGNVLFNTNIERFSSYYFDLARRADLIGLAGTLLQAAVVPLNVEFFSKPPHSEFVTPPHQDHAFLSRPAQSAILTLWVALDDATKESGALEFADTRCWSTLPHKTAGLDHFLFELCDQSSLVFRLAEVKRGGCVAHNSFAIHRSGPNMSSKFRRAIAFAYTPVVEDR